MAADSLNFGDTYSRRLPVYLLLDCSESMVGEPLDMVNAGRGAEAFQKILLNIGRSISIATRAG